MRSKIRVFIIDDSAAMRRRLCGIIAGTEDLEVVGESSDASKALPLIVSSKADVVTLDVEMPGMDGLTFLRILMTAHPLPVVMVSTHTKFGCSTTISAIEYGAVDFIEKPKGAAGHNDDSFVSSFLLKIRHAALANVMRSTKAAIDRLSGRIASVAGFRSGSRKGDPRHLSGGASDGDRKSETGIIAIGSSTGGMKAIMEIIPHLDKNTPGLVITQHLPQPFVESFAARLASLGTLDVHIARDGEDIRRGVALISPGDRHLSIVKKNGTYLAQVKEGPLVHNIMPSVSILFGSVAHHAGANSVGILLSGMGVDGAQELLSIKQAGGHTIAQDESTSVVYGMPKCAVELGAANVILPHHAIGAHIRKHIARA